MCSWFPCGSIVDRWLAHSKVFDRLYSGSCIFRMGVASPVMESSVRRMDGVLKYNLHFDNEETLCFFLFINHFLQFEYKVIFTRIGWRIPRRNKSDPSPSRNPDNIITREFGDGYWK